MSIGTGPVSGRRIYRNPPIQEVLIQVAFAKGALANAAVPGQLYERVRAEYPSDIETQLGIPVPVVVTEADVTTMQVERTLRHVFSDGERNRKLILTSEHLSANALPAYEGWEALLGRFERAATALLQAEPDLEASDLAVRYINRVSTPPPPVSTDDYFTVPVRTAEEGTAAFNGFTLRVQSVLADDPILCTTVSFGRCGR